LKQAGLLSADAGWLGTKHKMTVGIYGQIIKERANKKLLPICPPGWIF
jgi:hypothetical protein